MKEHLSRTEMFECVVAGGTAQQLAHVDECELCAREVQRTARLMGGTRAAISEWTGALQGADAAFLQRIVVRQSRRQQARVMQVCTAVLLALLAPAVMVEQRHAERVRRQADEVLLRQVDAALSENEPDAMRPLAKLVVWSDGGKQKGESTTEDRK